MHSNDNPAPLEISVGLRASLLSQAQLAEVAALLTPLFPHLHLLPRLYQTRGDCDQKSSLRTMDKTNFFTHEIDQALLAGECRLALHSAKDLPEPLPEGIQLVALTAGQDARDALVLPPGKSLATLPPRASIGTSSQRREEACKELRPDLTFVDIRGNIQQRLHLMESGVVDGVVIAEAALLRLQLHHLNRLYLPGETAPGQGQLALLAQAHDREMALLGAAIDSRTPLPLLYLGIDPSLLHEQLASSPLRLLHQPMVRVRFLTKRESADLSFLQESASWTHLLFTSKHAVDALFRWISPAQCHHLTIWCIGPATAKRVTHYGLSVDRLALLETGEGMALLLEELPEESYPFWPHSARSRPLLKEALERWKGGCVEKALYTVDPLIPPLLPPWEALGGLIFTSPSGVEAFAAMKREKPPSSLPLYAQGPQTRGALERWGVPSQPLEKLFSEAEAC